MISSDKIHVFFAEVPYGNIKSKLYPEKRQTETALIRNPSLKLQKISSWNLLSDILKDSFDMDMAQLTFSKNDNGKWLCDKVCFSISHCNELVAVAISKHPCGVDIEKDIDGRFNSALAKKILTPREFDEYITLHDAVKNKFVLEKWTQKESIYKMNGIGGVAPKSICTNDYPVETRYIGFRSDTYCVSVSSVQKYNTEYVFISDSIASV